MAKKKAILQKPISGITYDLSLRSEDVIMNDGRSLDVAINDYSTNNTTNAHKTSTVIDHPDNSITTAKLQNSSITDEKIGNRTIDDPAIGFGTFTGFITSIINRITDSIRSLRNSTQISLDTKEELYNKGIPYGYAGLDSNGKVPLSQVNDAILGNVKFQGLWNAAENIPILSPAPENMGHYYVVSVSGTQFGINFEVGDWIIAESAKWNKVDNTDAVSSVSGRTGNVVLTKNDVGLDNLENIKQAPLTHVASKGTEQHGLGDGINAGFSTNDYTNTEKNKLSGVQADAQVNVIEAIKCNGNTLSVSNKTVNIDVLTKTNTDEYTPASNYNPATKKYVDDLVSAAGAGDMIKSVYDSNNNGIVDNSEKLGGQLPDYYAKKTDLNGINEITNIMTSIGIDAGHFSNQEYSVLIGYQAGYQGASLNNVTIGYQAGLGVKNEESSGNVLIGFRAGYKIKTGGENVFIGYYAGYNAVDAGDSIFIGNSAGNNVTGGYDNIGIGRDALMNLTTGQQNIVLGSETGTALTTANNNIFIGQKVCNSFIVQSNTVSIGHMSGFNNKYGDSVFIGYQAGYNSSHTVGNNVYIGYQAGYSAGGYNVFIGYQAGYNSGYSTGNTYIGYQAGRDNYMYSNNTYIGSNAGYKGGTNCTFVGYYAGYNNTGHSNIFLGYQTGYNNTGIQNMFLGYQAGYCNTTAGNNTFIGYAAGYNITTGGQNTFIGFQTGQGVTVGNYNTYVGYMITSGSGEYGTMRLGNNTYTATTYIAGIYNRTAASGVSVLINSSEQLGTTTSSKRYKRNIENIDYQYVDVFFEKTRPIWYQSNTELCINDNPDYGWWGFIAEELAEVDPRLVHFDYHEDDYEIVTKSRTSSRTIPNPEYAEITDDDGNIIESDIPREIEENYEEEYEDKVLIEGAEKSPRSVHYDRITVLLTKEIQRLRKIIENQSNRITALENKGDL